MDGDPNRHLGDPSVNPAVSSHSATVQCFKFVFQCVAHLTREIVYWALGASISNQQLISNNICDLESVSVCYSFFCHIEY